MRGLRGTAAWHTGSPLPALPARHAHLTALASAPHPPPMLAASAFMEGWGHMVECGDVDAAFAQGCEMVLEGETKMGGQVGRQAARRGRAA